MRVRELLCEVGDVGRWAKEARGVVRAINEGQAIGNFAIAPAELDVDGAIRALFRGDAIYGIGVVSVRFQIAFGVVDDDRPEAVDGHFSDGELVDGRAIIASWRDREVKRVLFRIA